MRKLSLTLLESDARLLLEGLAELESKWAAICDTSQDEDEIADYGNDLIELRLLKREVEQQATEVFGGGVVDFGREPL